MYKFDCFNIKSLELLKRYDLLKPLLNKEIIGNLLETVDLNQEEKSTLIEKFLKKNRLEDGAQFDDWLEKKKLAKRRFY